MEKNKLSVIILTRNEAELIGDCIDCVKALSPDEILVIDDNSQDNTRQIAKQKGAIVVMHSKKNFAEARNFGKQKASSKWLLYIDADERVSKELAEKIKNSIRGYSKITAFSLTRVNYYLGKRWPKTEQMLRLFRRDALKEWFGDLHETAKIEGELQNLTEPLYHYTHRNISEMVANTNEWSETEAKLRFDAHHPPVVWWRIPRVMLPTFFDYYIGQRGYTVGVVGLIESIYQAFSIFITYAKLWELQNKIHTK